jgi:putative ABC transport system permease protein
MFKKSIEHIKPKDLLGLALRMFKVNPRRMILTILGIGISFSTIFFLLSLGYGLQKLVLGQFSSEKALLTLNVQSPDQDALPIDDAMLEKIRTFDHIKSIDPVVTLSGHIEFTNVAAEAEINGVSQEYLKDNAYRVSKGEFPEEGKKEIAISSTLEQIVNGGTESLIGKNATVVLDVARIDEMGIKVVDVVTKDTPYTIVGVVDEDTNSVYIPSMEMAGISAPYGLVRILVDSASNMSYVQGKVLELGLNASSIADTIDQANKVFTFFRVVLVLFGIASLIVAVIGMVNTMTIILLERTKEIGIMKIFGIATSDIKKLFMFESLIIGFLGGVSGLLLGFLFSELFNFGINILANVLGGQSVKLFVYPIWFVITITVFASVVGLAIGFFPSRRAAKVDPLIALSYK